MSKNLTCAIQIGTSRICAAAAWKDQFGNCEIAALEAEPAEGCVRKGCIVNVEAAAEHIKSLIQKLSNRVKSIDCQGINAAYVGICGISMHSKLHHPSTELEDGVSVNPEIIGNLRQQSIDMQMHDYDIFGLEPVGYTLDDVECLNPSGRTGSHLTAHHQLIIGQHRLRENVREAMEMAGVELKGIIATPLANACILTPDEKQRGCVLINMGESLTSVSVYSDGVLQHLAVIPLGGNAVTKDIANAGITYEEAEKAKINWSDVSGEDSTAPEDPSMPLEQSELNLIATCRYEEIAANILNQIEISGCKDHLDAGCIITGGASLQRGLTTLLSQRLGISRISTRSYSGISYGQSERRPQLSSLTTMLYFCSGDCAIKEAVHMPEYEQKPIETKVEEKPAEAPVEKPIEKAEVKTDSKTDDKKDNRPNTSSKKISFGRFFSDLLSGIDE